MKTKTPAATKELERATEHIKVLTAELERERRRVRLWERIARHTLRVGLSVAAMAIDDLGINLDRTE